MKTNQTTPKARGKTGQAPKGGSAPDLKEPQLKEPGQAGNKLDLKDFPGGETGAAGQIQNVSDKPAHVEDSPAKLESQTLEVPKTKVERTVEGSPIRLNRLPQVRAGVCEFCGVPFEQCEHYKGVPLRCSYCPPGKDTTAFRERRLFVFARPDNPDVLICVCEDYNCTLSHLKRFNQKFYSAE